MANLDPVFIKISENSEATDESNSLEIKAISIQPGDELLIGGGHYTVHKLKNDDDSFRTKDFKDLKANLKAYEELLRAGVFGYQIDDLCLRNNRNGNILMEFEVPEEYYQARKFNLLPEQHNFFVRLDSAMLNNRIKDKKESYDKIEINMTPCMFATHAALAIGASGKHYPITERSVEIQEEILDIKTATDLSLYEYEIISRLVGCINLINYTNVVDQVNTVIPHGAYYTFVFTAACQGFISPTLVLKWFDKVDQRVSALKHLIRKGLRRHHPSLPISQYANLDTVIDDMRAYFEACKAAEKMANLDELFEIVIHALTAKDPLTRQIFEAGVQKPTNFRELADFSYASCSLSQMVLKEGEVPQGNKLIIGVFDTSEAIAMYEAKKLRNAGLLTARGQFNPKVPKNTTYDHLSYINIMSIEHIAFDISQEFADKNMHGFPQLYSIHDRVLNDKMEDEIVGLSLGMD